MDEYMRVAYKIMMMAGIDTADFDKLTKRTKQQLIIRHTPYHIIAEKDSKVPRAYIKLFNSLMRLYEKQTFFGDPQYKVTYLDFVTYGLSFVFGIHHHNSEDNIISDDQHQRLDRINDILQKYLNDNDEEHYLFRTNKLMQHLSMYVSMPNYRYYTSIEGSRIDSQKVRIENLITVSSFEPEKKYFNIKGEKHPSFQLWHFDLLSKLNDPNPIRTEIPIVLMEEDDINIAISRMNEMDTIDKLPVYVQNHTLHRIRQRLDCVDNLFVSQMLSLTFIVPTFITATNGQQMIRVIDITGNSIGYFPFLKQDGAILLLSFLPLSSPITPEGSVLYKELGIKIDDSKYIGLDKISFYIKTDFETLPKLKQALQNANMWHLTEIKPETKTERKEDQILKRFFKDNNELEDVLVSVGNEM